MLVKLTEAVHDASKNRYSLREITINPQQIIAIREDNNLGSALQEGRITDGLSANTRFSRVYVGGGQYGLNLIIVGTPELIQEKISSVRSVLKG
jgi:hypothetical protein